MYRASDEVDNEEWLAELEAAADRLDLDDEARTRAADLYVATLVTSDRRAQGEVADAVGVSRLSVQQRWKELLERTGLEAPDW
jgi:hypothetical protein